MADLSRSRPGFDHPTERPLPSRPPGQGPLPREFSGSGQCLRWRSRSSVGMIRPASSHPIASSRDHPNVRAACGPQPRTNPPAHDHDGRQRPLHDRPQNVVRGAEQVARRVHLRLAERTTALARSSDPGQSRRTTPFHRDGPVDGRGQSKLHSALFTSLRQHRDSLSRSRRRASYKWTRNSGRPPAPDPPPGRAQPAH